MCLQRLVAADSPTWLHGQASAIDRSNTKRYSVLGKLPATVLLSRYGLWLRLYPRSRSSLESDDGSYRFCSAYPVGTL